VTWGARGALDQLVAWPVRAQVDHALESLVKSMKWDEEVGLAISLLCRLEKVCRE